MGPFVFLSVIIPSFNRICLLRKTVESLLKQSYPQNKYEIIVVDDGSTDETEEIIKKLQNKSSCNLKYCFQKNKGPAAARNLGIRYANGEIVAFVDSDCIVSSTWIEEICKGYDNEKIAGIGGRLVKNVIT